MAYIRIAEAAREIGVSRDTLRRLERAGKIAPVRDHAGHRRFSGDDIRKLTQILFGKADPTSLREAVETGPGE